MTNNLTLLLASKEDISCAMSMIQDAKDYHKEIGLDQWNADYPSLSDIETDVAAQKVISFATVNKKLLICASIWMVRRIITNWKVIG